VGDTVLRDFQDERRRAANDEVLQQLKANYEITIDTGALKSAVAPEPPANSPP